MEVEHIVWSRCDVFFSNVVLFCGSFIVFGLYFYFCKNQDLPIWEIFFSFLLITFSVFFFGDVCYRFFNKGDIDLLMKESGVFFSVGSLAWFKDNSIGFIDLPSLSSHGIVLGAVFGVLVYCFIFNRCVKKILDCCIVPLCVFFAILKVIDFFEVKNCGLITQMSWGFVFPNIDSLPRHPIMLYEFLLYMYAVVVLFYFFCRCRNITKEGTQLIYKDGFLFFLGIFIVYFVKIFLDFISVKGNLVSYLFLDFLHISIEQFLSVLFVIPSLIFVVFYFPEEVRVVAQRKKGLS